MSEIFSRIVRFLPAKPVIIDGGANTGQTCSGILSVRIQSRIHAFEPDPRAFDQLSRQPYVGKSVVANQKALSDEDGEIEFNLGCGTEISSTHPRVEGLGCAPMVEKVGVSCVRLDTYAREAGLDHIDLLKLDVQGHELSVLRGAESLLDTKRIGCIIAEVWMLSPYQRVPYYWEIAGWLDAKGYKTWWVTTAEYPDIVEGRWGDIAFVREDLIESTLKVKFR